MSLRIAVTGASGTTGRLVVAEVLSAGHTAIAIGAVAPGRHRPCPPARRLAGIRGAFELLDVPTPIERLGVTAAEPLV
jgi:uncharacterized protein YbjT (DUF2867 family)